MSLPHCCGVVGDRQCLGNDVYTKTKTPLLIKNFRIFLNDAHSAALTLDNLQVPGFLV